MKEDEAVAKALLEVARNEDGSVDEKALVDKVAELLDFDEDIERHAKAKRAVARRARPGSTEPEGILVIPGLEKYAYEPLRLIADEEGHVVEQAKARPDYKRAESQRAQDNLDRVAAWARRKAKEYGEYSKWAIQELSTSRPIEEITYDTFVRESGLWHAGDAPPESGPGDDS